MTIVEPNHPKFVVVRLAMYCLIAGALVFGWRWALNWYNTSTAADAYWAAVQSGNMYGSCLHAGVAARAFQEAGDDDGYREWRRIERAACTEE